MTPMKHRPVKTLLALAMFVLMPSFASADGMLPETTVIVLNEADGEASINVKNTDARAALLYSSIHDVPEDTERLVLLTPPVVRVEGGKTQLVRFLMETKTPLKTERLKRVFFEGIPQNKDTGSAHVSVTVRQDLPVILHPSGLPNNREPWKLLTWNVESTDLIVRNDSPYVVRLAQEIKLQPQATVMTLPRPYVLPGQTFRLHLPAGGARPQAVRLFPATVYGFSVESYDAPLVAVIKKD